MLPNVEREIQGQSFRIIMQPSAVGRPMLLQLSKLLAQGADRATLLGSDAAMLTGAITALDEAAFKSIWDKFSKMTEVMASEGYVPLSVAYPEPAGLTDYGLMLELIEAHIEANFASFFAVARAKLRELNQAPKQSASLKT